MKHWSYCAKRLFLQLFLSYLFARDGCEFGGVLHLQLRQKCHQENASMVTILQDGAQIGGRKRILARTCRVIGVNPPGWDGKNDLDRSTSQEKNWETLADRVIVKAPPFSLQVPAVRQFIDPAVHSQVLLWVNAVTYSRAEIRFMAPHLTDRPAGSEIVHCEIYVCQRPYTAEQLFHGKAASAP